MQDGRTALHYVAEDGEPETMQVLLDHSPELAEVKDKVSLGLAMVVRMLHKRLLTPCARARTERHRSSGVTGQDWSFCNGLREAVVERCTSTV